MRLRKELPMRSTRWLKEEPYPEIQSKRSYENYHSPTNRTKGQNSIKEGRVEKYPQMTSKADSSPSADFLGMEPPRPKVSDNSLAFLPNFFSTFASLTCRSLYSSKVASRASNALRLFRR